MATEIKKMKFNQAPQAAECGHYVAVTNIKSGSVVEVEVRTSDGGKPQSLIKGSELIRVGGNPEHLNPDHKYYWGHFEEA